MFGPIENPGITIRVINDIFVEIESKQQSSLQDYKIIISYLEIYNEAIRDLLANKYECLDLREDSEKGLIVSGLLEIEVNSPEQVMKLLALGNKNRITESTSCNEFSSRSHAVFQIKVEHMNKEDGIEYSITSGKLSLIDLAGSERAAITNNRGIRMVEGANINKSLLALGNCINALVDQCIKGTKNYIPFRDSKLTRLLKDSLGGNCKTVMIATINPSNAGYDDSHNTLKYANRAKNIKTKASKNVQSIKMHVSQYTNMIDKLKQEIQKIKNQNESDNVSYLNQENSRLFRSKLIEDTLKELNNHFEEDASLRKHIYKIKEKEAIKTLILKSLVSQFKSNSSDIPNYEDQKQALLKDIRSLEEDIAQCKKEGEELNSKYQLLNNKRSELLSKIKNPEFSGTELPKQLIHQTNLTKMIPMDLAYMKKANDVVISLFDNINQLREQIQIRDNIIEQTKTIISTNNINANLDDSGLSKYENLTKFSNELNNSIYAPKTLMDNHANHINKDYNARNNYPSREMSNQKKKITKINNSYIYS